MTFLPRYADREEQRDVLEALRVLPDVEIKRFELLAVWPTTVRFNRIIKPIAVLNGGCWQKSDPGSSPVVTGFVWIPKDDGIDVTFTGPTAKTMQVVTLIAYGVR